MKIIALVKQVPDTWADRVLDPATGRLDRGASDSIIDEIGERAIEIALRVKDKDKGTEVVVVTMGPAGASDVLRKGLAMGADSAVHILDDGLVGADLMTTARILSAAAQRIGFDVLVAGNESTDGRGGVIPAIIAEQLGLPAATFLTSVEISAGGVRGIRGSEDESITVSAPLPAVVSITETAAEARFPGFKGIMQAKKKPLEVWSIADLGAEPPMAYSAVESITERPARTAGKLIHDDGTAAIELVDYLAAQRLI